MGPKLVWRHFDVNDVDDVAAAWDDVRIWERKLDCDECLEYVCPLLYTFPSKLNAPLPAMPLASHLLAWKGLGGFLFKLSV